MLSGVRPGLGGMRARASAVIGVVRSRLRVFRISSNRFMGYPIPTTTAGRISPNIDCARATLTAV